MTFQPGLDVGMLVDRVVVRDQVNLFAFGEI